MDVLDVVVLVLVLGSAIHGIRLGAAVQIVSFAGFLLGIALGVALVVLIDPDVHGEVAKTVVAIALLLVPATVLGGAGRRLGARAWRALRGTALGMADAAGGAVFAVAGTLVVCWLFASILVNSSSTLLSSQIEQSRILRGVEAVLPPVPDAFSTVERYLSTSGFPEVLVNILPGSVGPVMLPSQSALRGAVAVASPSTVKVVAVGCAGSELVGSGFVAVASNGSPSDLVVTNAHVVAGSHAITVEAADGRVSPAHPVLFDDRFDLAVLRVAPLGEPPLQIDPTTVDRGVAAIVLGFPGGGPFHADPAGVLARFAAEGRDIYDNAITVRTVYELEATVRPGNSGGPLVSTSGEVIGVVFSRSSSNPDIGYALASPGVLSRVEQASSARRTVGTEGCVD